MYYLLLAFFLGQGHPNTANLPANDILNYPTTFRTNDDGTTDPEDGTTTPGPDTPPGDYGHVRPPRPKK